VTVTVTLTVTVAVAVAVAGNVAAPVDDGRRQRARRGGGTHGPLLGQPRLLRRRRALGIDQQREELERLLPARVAELEVQDSAQGIIAQLDALTLDRSGQFLDWKGGTYPW
jgi:hypothetical protein